MCECVSILTFVAAVERARANAKKLKKKCLKNYASASIENCMLTCKCAALFFHCTVRISRDALSSFEHTSIRLHGYEILNVCICTLAGTTTYVCRISHGRSHVQHKCNIFILYTINKNTRRLGTNVFAVPIAFVALHWIVNCTVFRYVYIYTNTYARTDTMRYDRIARGKGIGIES